MPTKEEIRKTMRLPCAVCAAEPSGKRRLFPQLCDQCAIAKLQVVIDKALDCDSTYQRLNDVGNANRLVMRHGRDYSYASERGWMRWTGSRWEEDKLLAIMEAAKDTVNKIRGEADFIPKRKDATEDEAKERGKATKALADWAKTSESRGRIDAMIHLAKSDPEVSCVMAAFDARLNLFNLQRS